MSRYDDFSSSENGALILTARDSSQNIQILLIIYQLKKQISIVERVYI